MTYGWKPWDKAKYNCTSPACLSPAEARRWQLLPPDSIQGQLNHHVKVIPPSVLRQQQEFGHFLKPVCINVMGFKYLLELELSQSHKTSLDSTSSMKIILKWRHFFPPKNRVCIIIWLQNMQQVDFSGVSASNRLGNLLWTDSHSFWQ